MVDLQLDGVAKQSTSPLPTLKPSYVSWRPARPNGDVDELAKRLSEALDAIGPQDPVGTRRCAELAAELPDLNVDGAYIEELITAATAEQRRRRVSPVKE